MGFPAHMQPVSHASASDCTSKSSACGWMSSLVMHRDPEKGSAVH